MPRSLYHRVSKRLRYIWRFNAARQLYYRKYYTGPPKNRKGFVIFSRGRSGTALLVDLLNSHPKFTVKGELLQAPLRSPLSYLWGRAASSNTLVFGFKVKPYQIERINQLDGASFLKSLQQAGWKLIFLEREELLRNCLSGLVARETGIWHSKKEAKADKPQVMLPPELVAEKLDALADVAKREKEIIAELDNYLHLSYEQDLKDAGLHQDTCNRIFEFLGVGSAPVKTWLKRTSTDRIEQQIRNWEEIKDYLNQIPKLKPYLGLTPEIRREYHQDGE